jgi:signal transduction histidine kinase
MFIELYLQKRELEDLVSKLALTQTELEKAVQIRDEFMSIASHELKTPLTSLKLQTQMRQRSLRKGGLASFTMTTLTQMFDSDEKQLDRITHLIDDMLDITRISSGKLSLNIESFDLCGLVRDAVERSSEQFIAAACPVELEVCPSAIGNWDRFRIEQVVINLLTNAMRYGAGMPIRVQVTALKDSVQLMVRDQGRGIAKENHERIFQRFERAVSGNEISGLGLGLYIVRQILEAHHASIHVESTLGQGAAFVVSLPMFARYEEVSRDV